MYFWWYTDWYNGAAYPRRSGRSDARRAEHERMGHERVAPSLTIDESLLHTVSDALLADPDVTGGRIDLGVQNGVVILDGEVDTETTRLAAIGVAWSVAGVTDVCDALHVTDERYGGSR